MLSSRNWWWWILVEIIRILDVVSSTAEVQWLILLFEDILNINLPLRTVSKEAAIGIGQGFMSCVCKKGWMSKGVSARKMVGMVTQNATIVCLAITNTCFLNSC